MSNMSTKFDKFDVGSTNGEYLNTNISQPSTNKPHQTN